MRLYLSSLTSVRPGTTVAAICLRALLLLALALFTLQPSSAAVTVTSIVVSPTSVTLTHGRTQQFAAIVTVTGGTSSGVTWSIDSIGSISSNGLYSAPASIFQTSTVTVTARSKDDITKFANATVTLQPTVAVTGVQPATVTLTAGQSQVFTATVTGTSNTDVTWSITPQLGTMTQDGTYTAPDTVTARQTVTVTAISVADPTVSANATVTLTPPTAVTVTVAPATVTLNQNGTQQFTATVANSSTTGVRWSISPATGTIDQTGLYTAPAIIASTSTVTVTATSLADATKSGTAKITLTAFLDVGTGAPTPSLVTLFQVGFYRNGFNTIAGLPPLGTVKRLGATGLYQEFPDINKTSGVKLALIMPNQAITSSTVEGGNVVFQMLSDIYAYYTSIGQATAGYPTGDTAPCPQWDVSNSCQWGLFDKNYALFSYKVSLFGGQNFFIRNNFYTKWTALGGINGLGRPVDTEVSVTAATGSVATMQTYANGATYQYVGGANNGKYYAVSVPIYTLYQAQGGPASPLGFPTGDELVLANGNHRQMFQNNNSIEYTPGQPPILRPPVWIVALSGMAGSSSTVQLKQGDTVTVTAQPTSIGGDVLSDRVVSWSTTNSRVISIQANGQSAVMTAVGGGVATVTASSEGIVSPKITFVVTAPCCQLGDGAPPAVQQSFQDALTRNKVTIALPVAAQAVRLGNGYVQVVQTSDGTTYLVAKSDSGGTSYLLTGDILKAFQQQGGASGTLGYPISDLTAGGRQMFEQGALAGSPVRMVSAAILTKWSLLGYETGVAGLPVSDAVAFATFGANAGNAQSFAGGVIYAATSGPRAGQSYLAGGLILARYNALGGPAGAYGMPTSDEFVTGTLHQQNFEGGTFDYTAGDSAAKEHPSPKVPGIVISPSNAVAGSRVRLAVVGFPNATTIKVSVTGLPDFQVAPATGAYSWDMYLPLTTPSSVIAVHAVDTKGTATADGTITVKGLAENRVLITKLQGDNQSGMPGSLLPRSLKVVLRDSGGGAVSGATVTFQGSPGVTVAAASVVTDQNGQAETLVRLPSSSGLALVRVDAPSVALNPVTFNLLSVASQLSGFPLQTASSTAVLGAGPALISQKGALVAAIASILRYHQTRGDVPLTGGLADPVSLNQFLTTYCTLASVGAQACDGYLANPDGGDQVANLWRAGEYVGGQVDPEVGAPTQAAAVDWLAQGSPALLALSMTMNGNPAGGHYVVATGVADDGSLLIADPNPNTARTSLNDYLNGFSYGGVQWKGTLTGVARFALRTPVAGRFLLAALSQTPDVLKSLALTVQSAAGACGTALDLPDAADMSGGVAGSGKVSRLLVCDGAQPVYQLSVGAGQAFRTVLIDLTPGGVATDLSGQAVSAYQVSRRGGILAVSSLQLSFTADAVVNAATYAPGLAPGSLMSIFGTGLVGTKGNTTVTMDSTAVTVVSANSFQINAQVPATMAVGVHNLTVKSDFGQMVQQVQVSAVAPAIFLVGNPPVGAIVNPSGTINGAGSPIQRGQVLVIYGTGFGAVQRSGNYSVTTATVTAMLNGVQLPVSFAGLAPGFVGLYQVNVPVPSNLAPGLDLPFSLKVGSSTSNSVPVSVQ